MAARVGEVENQRDRRVVAEFVEIVVGAYAPSAAACREPIGVVIPCAGPLQLRVSMPGCGVHVGNVSATDDCALHPADALRRVNARSTFAIASRMSSMSPAVPRNTELA